MQKLLEIIKTPGVEKWSERNNKAFLELFGTENNGRYPSEAKNRVNLRAPDFSDESNVPFAAYIHPSNPDRGPYGGMSFVIFPIKNGPCLIAMGIGTQGLSPDEAILGRPGHGRKVKAICSCLNKKFGNSEIIAWAKDDPFKTEIDIPKQIKNKFEQYNAVFERYGKVLYGIFAPSDNDDVTEFALKAFLDLNFEERNQSPLKSHRDDYEYIRSLYFSYLMPDAKEDQIFELLKERRYVILEGPPGTGKSRAADILLKEFYKNNGFSIQFHPNTTYENFIGGLAPVISSKGLGFAFAPQMGYLMKAIEQSLQNPSKQFLLHIDEINRADLSKVLGEAIYLLELKTENTRKITLSYNFGHSIKEELTVPENLHVLGTMNSADRSIAIVDIAVRRRFAFMKLWPQKRIVSELGGNLMNKAFDDLVSIFVEYASNDAFALIPGHSYFLEKDDKKSAVSLKTNLTPLLEEYLAQGYVAAFSDAIQTYLQWIDGLKFEP